jgi:tripartite-type tricarboxylate transporter receptor subunit TctC
MGRTLWRKAALGCVVFALFAPAASWAQAQYPSRPIRLIVGFPPGGLTDVSARLISANASGLGQAMVVENRPGGGSLIGVRAVVDAPADGYTVGYVASAITQQRVVSRGWDIDPLTQLAPISIAVQFPLAIAINPRKHPAKTLGEFLGMARADRGKFNFATVTVNGSDAMVLKLLSRAAGADALLVNYKGGMATAQAVMTGEADAFTVAPQTAISLLPQGTVRLLAVTGSSRFRALPDVPTLQEAGYPGFSLNNWFGFVAPAGTPQRAISALNAALVVALHVPAVEKSLVDSGTDIVGNSPEEFARVITSELAAYRKMVADGVVEVGD